MSCCQLEEFEEFEKEKTYLDSEFKFFGSGFTKYQDKIINFFKSFNQTALLLYFTVGCGKTITALGCSYAGIKEGKFNNVIILSPKSIQDEFKQNIKLLESFKQNTEFNEIFKSKIHMIPYNAYNSFSQIEKLKQKLNFNFEKTIWIIDELHLFLRSIIKVRIDPSQPNLSTEETGNAEKILNLIKTIKNKKVIGLTGTPVFKNPVEITPFFNLNGVNFPENVEEFNNRYVEIIGNDVSLKNVDELKNKLKNSVAYVSLPDSQHLKVSKLIEEEIEMSQQQYKQYLIDYKLECEEEGFSKGENRFGMKFGKNSTFHAKTFQDSIYVPVFKNNSSTMINKYSSPKIIKMFEDTKNIFGKIAFYFRFVEIGVQTMEQKLIQEKYSKFTKSDIIMFKNNTIQKKNRYMIFTGEETDKFRNECKNIFNDSKNKYGEYIKYILLSPSGATGITLKCVRFLGLGSVDFNYGQITQILGRCNRLNSHIDLPESERTLTNKIYLSVKNKKYYLKHKKEIDQLCSRKTYKYENEEALCIERIIFQDSKKDDLINEAFRKILINVSII